MSTMVMRFKKILLMALVIVLGWSALPAGRAHAAVPEPPTPQAPLAGERLERIWAREQAAYERLGRLLEQAEGWIPKAQQRLERARENGKDTAAVQAALETFAEAVKNAHPLYQSGEGILASHKGFDDSGRVTDAARARQTVEDLGKTLKQIRDLLRGPARALREAVRELRQADPSAAQ